jgi:hypothetical protein
MPVLPFDTVQVTVFSTSCVAGSCLEIATNPTEYAGCLALRAIYLAQNLDHINIRCGMSCDESICNSKGTNPGLPQRSRKQDVDATKFVALDFVVTGQPPYEVTDTTEFNFPIEVENTTVEVTGVKDISITLAVGSKPITPEQLIALTTPTYESVGSESFGCCRTTIPTRLRRTPSDGNGFKDRGIFSAFHCVADDPLCCESACTLDRSCHGYELKKVIWKGQLQKYICEIHFTPIMSTATGKLCRNSVCARKTSDPPPAQIANTTSISTQIPTPNPVQTPPPTPFPTPTPTPLLGFDLDAFDWVKQGDGACLSTVSGTVQPGNVNVAANCQSLCGIDCLAYEYNKKRNACTLFSTSITGVRRSTKRRCWAKEFKFAIPVLSPTSPTPTPASITVPTPPPHVPTPPNPTVTEKVGRGCCDDGAGDPYSRLKSINLAGCQDACSTAEKCTGFEHNDAKRICKLFIKPISGIRPNSKKYNYDCFRKSDTVLVFRPGFALEDVIGSHTCSLEVSMFKRARAGPMPFLSVFHCLLPLPPYTPSKY